MEIKTKTKTKQINELFSIDITSDKPKYICCMNEYFNWK